MKKIYVVRVAINHFIVSLQLDNLMVILAVSYLGNVFVHQISAVRLFVCYLLLAFLYEIQTIKLKWSPLL